jgi:hypothetical protein
MTMFTFMFTSKGAAMSDQETDMPAVQTFTFIVVLDVEGTSEHDAFTTAQSFLENALNSDFNLDSEYAALSSNVLTPAVMQAGLDSDDEWGDDLYDDEATDGTPLDPAEPYE